MLQWILAFFCDSVGMSHVLPNISRGRFYWAHFHVQKIRLVHEYIRYQVKSSESCWPHSIMADHTQSWWTTLSHGAPHSIMVDHTQSWWTSLNHGGPHSIMVDHTQSIGGPCSIHIWVYLDTSGLYFIEDIFGHQKVPSFAIPLCNLHCLPMHIYFTAPSISNYITLWQYFLSSELVTVLNGNYLTVLMPHRWSTVVICTRYCPERNNNRPSLQCMSCSAFYHPECVFLSKLEAKKQKYSYTCTVRNLECVFHVYTVT